MPSWWGVDPVNGSCRGLPDGGRHVTAARAGRDQLLGDRRDLRRGETVWPEAHRRQHKRAGPGAAPRMSGGNEGAGVTGVTGRGAVELSSSGPRTLCYSSWALRCAHMVVI